ncbi:MAG TPA: HAMP domain-containing sensor histidine kinase [Kofleriaceae bacterium]|nr:HAMP domain-containing sensor histidine kinase [Kofleriaceae bacterium]
MKKPPESNDAEGAASAREKSVANRETWVRARERLTGEHEILLHDREEAVTVREASMRARTEAEAARVEREHLLVQMREANEKLVMATLRAGESESAARASDRAKDDFIARLGHELRNPLAPILIALDLIAMDGPDSHEREHAIIGRQVNHLIQLVDDLFDVSRIRSGKLSLQCEPIEMADVIWGAVEMARPMIDAHAHVLTIEVPRQGLAVNGDAVRLAQVVGNLLTNAAKFTPSGGTIAVMGERHDTTVVLRIRDTGIGISPQMLPRLFDAYVQQHRDASHVRSGLGLGLAIVRSLVEMHGGTVTAHSKGLGLGSEFLVGLPLVTIERSSDAA